MFHENLQSNIDGVRIFPAQYVSERQMQTPNACTANQIRDVWHYFVHKS